MPGIGPHGRGCPRSAHAAPGPSGIRRAGTRGAQRGRGFKRANVGPGIAGLTGRRRGIHDGGRPIINRRRHINRRRRHIQGHEAESKSTAPPSMSGRRHRDGRRENDDDGQDARRHSRCLCHDTSSQTSRVGEADKPTPS
jgi:hypothetical protein